MCVCVCVCMYVAALIGPSDMACGVNPTTKGCRANPHTPCWQARRARVYPLGGGGGGPASAPTPRSLRSAGDALSATMRVPPPPPTLPAPLEQTAQQV